MSITHSGEASYDSSETTLIVSFALQRYFIAGLTIGAEKG